MLKEKIKSYFSRFPKLKVLFFFDEKQEYLQEVEELDIEDIHIEFYQNNPFEVKTKLLFELNNQKVLLYLPMSQPNDQESYLKFPLMGLLTANMQVQLDNVGTFMEDYALQRHQKSLVARYIKELKYSTVQEICNPILNAENFKESNLQKALVSAFLKFRNIEDWQIITAKFISLSYVKDSTVLDRAIKKIVDLNFENEVLKRIKDHTEIAIDKLSAENLQKLARAVLYNKITQTITDVNTNDPYSDLKINDSSQITYLNQMLYDVERNQNLSTAFNKAMIEASKDIKGSTLIEVYGVEANFAEFTNEMIWAIIAELKNNISINPALVIQRLDTISLQSNLDENIKQSLKYIVQIAKMYKDISEIESYILDTPELYLQTYAEEWYKIDYAYRKAISTYKNMDISDMPNTVDLEQIRLDLNEEYNKHTSKLNTEWLRCLDQLNFDYSRINIPKQFNFYNAEIDGNSTKVVVVISDALRYEAANELLSQMHGDPKNTAEIKYMLASIPSKTNVGMANLLPGNKIFNNGNIESDGISTSGTENRSKLLQKYNPNSSAIQYSDLQGLSRKDTREIFKRNVVYVYHDVIDSTGDKRNSERRTFDAVEDAIEELKKFVKNLHASLNVAKVIITADHGFLYNDKEIEEKDKESIVSDTVMSGNRYFITTDKQDSQLTYSIPLSSTTSFDSNLYVNIPISVNRYKKQGVGQQFAHGGGSLQELVVPLIESSRQRVEVTKKVSPMLVNSRGLKIVSNILKLNILQETPISRLEKELTITVGLYKGSTLVSNIVTLTLNSTAESPSERMYRVDLTLSADSATDSFLKLKIFDADDSLNPIIEERVENGTLINPDF